jgi:hypothetical protein
VFVVDDDAAIREALESLFDVGRIAGRAHAAHAGSRRCRPKYGTGHTSAHWSTRFDCTIIVKAAYIVFIGSAPRLAEDVAALVPVFPPPTDAESHLNEPGEVKSGVQVALNLPGRLLRSHGQGTVLGLKRE